MLRDAEKLCMGKLDKCSGACLSVSMLDPCMHFFFTSSSQRYAVLHVWYESFFVASVLHVWCKSFVASAAVVVALLSFGILSPEPRIDEFECFRVPSFFSFVTLRFMHLLPVRGF